MARTCAPSQAACHGLGWLERTACPGAEVHLEDQGSKSSPDTAREAGRWELRQRLAACVSGGDSLAWGRNTRLSIAYLLSLLFYRREHLVSALAADVIPCVLTALSHQLCYFTGESTLYPHWAADVIPCVLTALSHQLVENLRGAATCG